MGVMTMIGEELRAKAEVYYGDKICQEKTRLLLKEVGLPNGLLPLKDIIECGHVEETGLVWMRQKRRVDHLFEKVGRTVSFATEVLAYVEKGRVRVVKGIKAKEMMVWVSVSELAIEGSPTEGKIVCKALAGLYRVFPASAFILEEKEY